MCEKLQRYFTLRGADAITDHGAENVETAQRTSTEICFALRFVFVALRSVFAIAV